MLRRAGWVAVLLVAILAACGGDDDADLPTPLNPDAVSTQRAEFATQTAVIQATLQTHTPTLSPTATATHTFTPPPTLTPSRTATPTRTPTVTPTRTPTATRTASNTPTLFVPPATLTQSPTPSQVPTRALNPDGVISENPAALLVEPGGESVGQLDARSPLTIQGRTADNRWLQIALLNGRGSGWVDAASVIAFITLDEVPIFGGVPQVAEPADTAPLAISQNIGEGPNLVPYDYAACGETYWAGTVANREQILTATPQPAAFSMPTVSVAGRYPRYAGQPIRVVILGAGLGDTELIEWEAAISRVFAELSQAVTLQRAFADDLDFFSPIVPPETLLADLRVDMIVYLTEPSLYAEIAPCDNPLRCAQMVWRGPIIEGPLRLGSYVWVSAASNDRQRDLLHAMAHGLGLYTHSDSPDDLMFPAPFRDTLSERDVAALRCLYNAPPFGDGVLDITATPSPAS